MSLPMQQPIRYPSFLAHWCQHGTARSRRFVAPEACRSLRRLSEALASHQKLTELFPNLLLWQTAAKQSHCPWHRKAESSDLSLEEMRFKFRRDAKFLSCQLRHYHHLHRFIYFLVTKWALLQCPIIQDMRKMTFPRTGKL